MNRLLQSTKRSWYQNQIKRANSQKELFQITHELLNSKRKTHLPTYFNDNELTERFSSVFTSKIEKIRNGIERSTPEFSCHDQCADFTPTFLTFKEVNPVNIINVIDAMKPKSCVLDPYQVG